MIKYISMFRLVLRCLLVARKENLTGVSTGLTGRSTLPVPVDQTGFHLWQITPGNLECVRRQKVLQKFAEVTFQNLSIFEPKFKQNDVTKQFCGVTTFRHFMIQYWKQTYMYKIWTGCDVIKKWLHFSKTWLWRHIDDVINSKLIFLKTFGEHQTARQIRCFHDFWFRS